MDKIEKELVELIKREKSAFEVRKEDDYYFVGPFWIISDSVEELNKGNFKLIIETFLVDYGGNYLNRVPRSQFTHKGIWESKYKNNYGNLPFDYYPRGRISFYNGQIFVNIPRGLNETLVIKALSEPYDFDYNIVTVKYTDPTSGNHYSFQLK